MSEIQRCSICGYRFWPEQGHTCRYTGMGDVAPRPAPFTAPSLTADEVRQIVREELERAALGKTDGEGNQ